MARRKTGSYRMRVDPDNIREWRREAQRESMSLASWLEALANREVLDRRQERRLQVMYPQKYGRNPVDRHIHR
jgi:hypothetical protein